MAEGEVQSHLFFEHPDQATAHSYILEHKIPNLIQNDTALLFANSENKPVQLALLNIFKRKSQEWNQSHPGRGDITLRGNWDFRKEGNVIVWKVGTLAPGQAPKDYQKLYAIQEEGKAKPDSIGFTFTLAEVEQEMNAIIAGRTEKLHQVLAQRPDLNGAYDRLLAQINDDIQYLMAQGNFTGIGEEYFSLVPPDNNMIRVEIHDVSGKRNAIDIALPDISSIQNRFAALHNQVAGKNP